MLNQKKTIPIVIVIAIIVVASVVYFYKAPTSDDFRTEWVVSGPFAISQPTYKLGENIFLSVHGLKPDETGNILIIQPNGVTWVTIPFNGTLKSDFNYYNKPDTNVAKKIFKPEDLVGTWKVIFQGASYEPISFEILNEFVKGAEKDIVSIETNATEKIGPEQK